MSSSSQIIKFENVKYIEMERFLKSFKKKERKTFVELIEEFRGVSLAILDVFPSFVKLYESFMMDILHEASVIQHK